MIVGNTARHTNADFEQRQSFDQLLPFSAKNTYMLHLRALDQIYGAHFQHRHGFEYILAIRDAAAQKQYFSTASVFNVPITLRWLVFAWNYKEEKKANGLVRASDLKIKAFFIYLRTYLALRNGNDFPKSIQSIYYVEWPLPAFLAAAYLNDIHTHSLVKIKLYGRGHSFFFYSCYET